MPNSLIPKGLYAPWLYIFDTPYGAHPCSPLADHVERLAKRPKIVALSLTFLLTLSLIRETIAYGKLSNFALLR